MNANAKGIFATLIFADLRQITNRTAVARHHSILADDVQPDRRFLLSSHESTSHVRPVARSALRALTWKSSGGRRKRTGVVCSASRRCLLRRNPISHSSTLSARGSVSAAGIRYSSARPGTTNTNDGTKASRKDSKRLLAPSHRGPIWRRNTCGEPTVEDFLKRVGEEYLNPRVKEGRRQLWLIDDLDTQSLRAIYR